MRAYVEMLEKRLEHIRVRIDRVETDYTNGDIPVNESTYKEVFPPIENLTIKSEGKDGNAPRPYFNAARLWRARIKRLFLEKKARFEKIPEIPCADVDQQQTTTGSDPKPEPKAPPKPTPTGPQPPAPREVRLLPVPPHFCSWNDKQTLWNLAYEEWRKADQNVEDLRQYLKQVRTPDAEQKFKKALADQDAADAVMREISKRKIIDCNKQKEVGWVPNRPTGAMITLNLGPAGNSTAGSAPVIITSAPLTAINGGSSLQIASANLGAGPVFLNNLAIADKKSSRITAIDGVAGGPSVKEEGTWSLRGRVGFALTDKLSVYGSVDFGSRQQVFTDPATQQLVQSATSTAAFYRELFAGGTNLNVQSTAIVTPGDHLQAAVTGGVERLFSGVYIPGFDEMSVWAGAGVRTGGGDGATATIDTRYLFNVGAAQFGDANTTTLTASTSSSFGAEFGATFRRTLTANAKLAAGIGMEFYRNTTTIAAQAESTQTMATPSGVITLTSPAGVYQVSNVGAVKPSLSLPLGRTITWKGSGTAVSPRVFFGLEWKF
jgi:hypothetical protein